jgi:hypothetical protein
MTGTITNLKTHETDIAKEVAAAGVLAVTEDAAEYARAAQCMALVLFCVRQSGRELPDSYAIQNFDMIRRCATAMVNPAYVGYLPDNTEAEGRAYDPTFGTGQTQMNEIRKMMLELTSIVSGSKKTPVMKKGHDEQPATEMEK